MPRLELDLTRPPQEAVDYFAAKGDRITWDWHEMLRQAHDEAFTVAKATSADVLAAIKAEVGKAIGEGQTFEQFKRTLKPRLMALGWWGRAEVLDGDTGELTPVQLGSDRRLRTIYNTNIQTAYMAGRHKRQVDNAHDRPFWQYVAIEDGRTRPAHAALNGRVFRWDDPVWRIIYPPNGFGCRCRVRALSGDQVSQQGLSVSSGSGQVVSKEVRLSADAPAVTVQGISGLGEKGGAFYPDPGWDYNPGDAQAAQLRLQRLAEQKADAAARPAKVKPLAFNTRTKAGEWHNAAFADSPDWLKRVLVREQSVRVQARSKGAWARGSELIDTDGCTKNARGLTTWRHEMGHILDYRLGRTTYVSSSAEFVKASALDARSVLRAKEARQSLASISPDEVGTVLNGVGATTEEFSRLLSRSTGQQVPADPATWKATAGARVEQLVSALAQRDAEAFVAALQRIERQDAAHVSLSDLVGSSTLNRACHPNQGFPGHTDDYYAKASLYGHTESFANLTALAGHPLPIWWTLTKWFFPELTAVYERIIRSA